ncbi:MAG: helix-turn-helix transcriptional regulator [Cryomorphaceae bacterium]|nr:helix-turn-helix transcriptional regulator [Cryomorphaceae bacterium]
MENYNKVIAQKLRKVREIKGFSQESVALASELSQRQYQRIETGESDLTL